MQQSRQKTQKSQKDKETCFSKKSVENADFYKPVLNKIIITHEQCVEYNFVALLIILVQHKSTVGINGITLKIKVIEKTCLTTDCQTTKINPENNAVIVFDRKIYLQRDNYILLTSDTLKKAAFSYFSRNIYISEQKILLLNTTDTSYSCGIVSINSLVETTVWAN